MKHQSEDGLSPLYLITDRKRAYPDLLHALDAALAAGVRLVQLREKDLSEPDYMRLAKTTLTRTRQCGAKLILNCHPQLAQQLGADGIHLGVHSTSVATARQILGDQALIGYSAHSTQEIIRAAEDGANFATFSPVYYTPSKAQYGPPQGLDSLAQACLNAPIPVYALGGITASRIPDVIHAGAHGIAAISAIMTARDPHKSVKDIFQTLHNSFL